jgi:hypothetical protein
MDIAAYYALGLERDRLAGGPGALEFARTQALIERYLLPSPASSRRLRRPAIRLRLAAGYRAPRTGVATWSRCAPRPIEGATPAPRWETRGVSAAGCQR